MYPIDNPEEGKSTYVCNWHPIDGEWVKCEQRTDGFTRKYYTDGVLAAIAKVHPVQSAIKGDKELIVS